MRHTVLILFLVLCISNFSFAGELILSTIPDGKIKYDCGCNYRLDESAPLKLVFQSDLSFDSPKVFIDGNIVSLDPISVAQIPVEPKIGDTFVQHYRYKKIDFIFYNTITFVCPRDSKGGCEVTEFRTRLEISQSGKVSVMQLLGDCGC